MVEEGDIVKNLDGMTDETKLNTWADLVRSDINGVLDIFLPISIDSRLNIGYYPHVIETLETGDVKDPILKGGAILTISLKFNKPIDITKPRME